MKKYLIVISILIVIFISACKSQETVKGSSNLLSYDNKDLGISFKYPSTFKVYQADKNSLSVDSGYIDSQYPLAQILIGIRKSSPNRLSLQEIESMINPDLSGILKPLEDLYQTKEDREELRRQIEYTKTSAPENYKVLYGDKTTEQATEAQIAETGKLIKSYKTKRTYKVMNKENYDLVVVDSLDRYYPHYLLSDKGTFIVDHLQQWQGGFIPEQEYNSYKEKFDSVIDSIKII